MSIDAFTLSWFIIFAFIILIAFLANLIIVLAILKDKSMHTSTYFYIINVNIADILLLLTCLPERLAEVIGYTEGFHLGMLTCYLIPFLQQVAIHAALGFLLVLTIHRCYPTGIPRFLQGDHIRRYIRRYSYTLIIVWTFAIIINLPLFSITKYEPFVDNQTNATPEYICHTGATEIWTRIYLISLLVCTYLITGIFLIMIYGQAIRVILASKKFTQTPVHTPVTNNHYRYILAPTPPDEQLNSKRFARLTGMRDNLNTYSTPPSSIIATSNRRQQAAAAAGTTAFLPQTPLVTNNLSKPMSNSHSAQHLQVIVMLFIVILLYILLLLPYRLFNLLLIVYNQIFEQTNMNDNLFRCLFNIVRLLVYLNCALQPLTYLIISSRLRQTVLKFCKCICQCHCTFSSSTYQQSERHYKSDTRAIRAYLSQKYHPTLGLGHSTKRKRQIYQHTRSLQTSLNALHLIGNVHGTPLNLSRAPSPITASNYNKPRYVISFNNTQRNNL